jgi:hypothetical protein
MTETLTPERLAEIKARCEKATKGPWAEAEDKEEFWGYPIVSLAVSSWGSPDTVGMMTAENQEFVIHSRSDVPLLIAALETAEAENERLRALSQKLYDGQGVISELRAEAHQRAQEAEAEVSRLRRTLLNISMCARMIERYGKPVGKALERIRLIQKWCWEAVPESAPSILRDAQEEAKNG